MKTLGITQSVCATCRRIVPAKVLSDGERVSFRKFCPAHGEDEAVVSNDAEDYLRSHRYVKPAWVPREFAGNTAASCPDGCGFCARHEQHLCLPIVEITTRCNLACPICLVDAGGDWDMTPDEFAHLLDVLVAAEGQIDVLNLSGGEPLLHPRVLDLVDLAVARPEVVRVSISTNGLPLLADASLLPALQERNVIVCLQFDGFDDGAYVALRGRPLLAEKMSLLDLLSDADATTSLTVTVAAGVNEDQLAPTLDYVFSHEHTVSMMIQPLAFEGRAAAKATGTARMGISDVVRALGDAGHPAVRADDFVPLPCSHPLCFNLAFYLMTDDGRAVSLSRLFAADDLLDAVSNRVFFGLDPADQDRMKEMVYELWSGPAASSPDSVAVVGTVRDILRKLSSCCHDPQRVFDVAERRIKSIFIHAFQDADSFDLARVRRCCNAYPQPDGRMMPACVHNVMRRGR